MMTIKTGFKLNVDVQTSHKPFIIVTHCSSAWRHLYQQYVKHTRDCCHVFNQWHCFILPLFFSDILIYFWMLFSVFETKLTLSVLCMMVYLMHQLTYRGQYWMMCHHKGDIHTIVQECCKSLHHFTCECCLKINCVYICSLPHVYPQNTDTLDLNYTFLSLFVSRHKLFDCC